jgi:hypothetical protein
MRCPQKPTLVSNAQSHPVMASIHTRSRPIGQKTRPDTCLVFIFYFLTQFPWESRGANHEQNQAQREVHIVSSSYGLISLTKIAHLSKQVPKVILLFANLLVFAITDISECVAIIICRLRILESLKLATKENRNANVRFPVPFFDHEEKGVRRRLGARAAQFLFGYHSFLVLVVVRILSSRSRNLVVRRNSILRRRGSAL